MSDPTTATPVVSVTACDGGLAIEVAGSNDAVTLSWRWVRDHGEDPASFDTVTRQRRIDVITGTEPVPATKATIEGHAGDEIVSLTWPDEPRRTWISVATIGALVSPAAPTERTLWDHGADAACDVHSVKDVLADDKMLTSWLRDTYRLGFGRLSGFAGDHHEAETLTRRIAYPRTTIFGTMWDLAADLDEHDDTAYSTSSLGPHTDGTYSHDAPGLQMFCCIERTGRGGESILVDGFAAAERLRHDNPEHFRALTTVEVPAHYIEPGVELRATRPALRHGPTSELLQVSFNNYDRSPMLLPQAQMGDFYEAYGHFHTLVNDPECWLSIGLEAGDVLVIDNWRLLHGRQSYTGARRFIGCYMNHEDFESRCRVLGIAL